MEQNPQPRPDENSEKKLIEPSSELETPEPDGSAPTEYETRGVMLDSRGKLVVNNGVKLRLQRNIDVSGFGLPMTLEAGHKQVLGYLKRLAERIKQAAPEIKAEVEESVNNETICVSMGRETILRILSQQGCEGIRFYLADGCDQRSIGLVAIGMNKLGHELGLDLGTFSLIQPQAKSLLGGVDDCNPPFTRKDLAKLKSGAMPLQCHEEANALIEKVAPAGFGEFATAILDEFDKLLV